ncbi:MAG TPA: DUF1996 domain-containing protein [Kofleriaceae bacterium]|nr:DUF1996 domain-containing protein [Kofleriaceae bacterium]
MRSRRSLEIAFTLGTAALAGCGSSPSGVDPDASNGTDGAGGGDAPTDGHDHNPPPGWYMGGEPDPIPSNFDTSQFIGTRPLQNAGAGGGEGAFRFICLALGPDNQPILSYDDPIVYPGQTGAAHLHQFFGNTLTNANSTYETLRTTGDGTCQGEAINRTAYWIPALLDGTGNVVVPNHVIIYYKGEDPNLTQLPRGLRYIAGDPAFGNLTNDEAYGSPNGGVLGGWEGIEDWRCESGGPASLTIPTNCAVGTNILARVPFPHCWDGTNLDSPNHRTHVVHAKRDNNTGQSSCPATHPKILPRFTIQVSYSILAGDDVTKWRLSSDNHGGVQHEPGSTLHADWFGAWDDQIMTTWTQKCLREVRNGNDADYCDGTGGKWPRWNWLWGGQHPTPRVPVPPDPTP